jgi:mannose-1-phosphate guanylyltransferase
MIPALVLCAGLATRLRPLSLVRAKAALPVAGEPLVQRILRWLATCGIRDVVINLHHLPHTITCLVGDGADEGLRVRYSWENPVLGSAGGPVRALPILGANRLLVVNGDTLTDLDLAPLVDDHMRSGALVTMAVVPNRHPEKYSGLAVAPDGAVTGVVARGATEPSYHYFGVQVIEAAALAPVPAGVPYETVKTLYPSWIAERPGSVRAYVSAADSLDIGTPSDYLATSLMLARREGHATIQGARCQVAPDASVRQSVLWDDVVVGAGAMLRECVVADGAHVPADTSWHGVSLRVAAGELAEGERRIGDLAVASL